MRWGKLASGRLALVRHHNTTADPPGFVALTLQGVNGQPGLAYSDLLGWRSLTWAVDRDAVMSVTGLNIDDTELQQIAEGARFG